MLCNIELTVGQRRRQWACINTTLKLRHVLIRQRVPLDLTVLIGRNVAQSESQDTRQINRQIRHHCFISQSGRRSLELPPGD